MEPPGRTILDNALAVPEEARVTTFLHPWKARLSNRKRTTRQEAHECMKKVHQSSQDESDRKALNAPPSSSNVRQYIYIVRPPLTSSTAEGMANESYNKVERLTWEHS